MSSGAGRCLPDTSTILPSMFIWKARSVGSLGRPAIWLTLVSIMPMRSAGLAAEVFMISAVCKATPQTIRPLMEIS